MSAAPPKTAPGRMRVLAGLALAVVALVAAGCDRGGQPRDAAAAVAQARQLLEEGNLRDATILLKDVLQRDPERPDARWLLARAYIAGAQPDAAIKELRRAIELGLDEEVGLPALARAHLLKGDVPKVLEVADPARVRSPAAKAELHALRAAAHLARGRRAEARRELEHARAQAPDSVLARIVAARLALVEGRRDEAAALARQAIEASGGRDRRPWELLIEALAAGGRVQEAERVAGEALEATGLALFRFHRAMFRLRLGRLDEAQADVEALARAAPKSWHRQYAAGILAFQRRDYAAAEERLAEAARLKPYHYPTLLYLGAARIALGRENSARETLRRAVRVAPGRVMGRLLLGALLLGEGDVEGARKVLDPVERARVRHALAQEVLAALALAEGDAGRAAELLARAHRTASGRERERLALGLGRLLLRSGRTEEALAVLDAYREGDSDAARAAQAMEALALVRAGRADEALRLARAARAGDAVWRALLESQVHVWSGAPERAAAVLKAAWQKEKAEPLALALARLAAARGALDEALGYLDTLREAGKATARAAALRARIELARGRTDEAKRLLRGLLEDRRLGAAARLRLAALELAAGNADEAEALLRGLPEAARRTPAVRELDVRIALARGRLEEARKMAAGLAAGWPRLPQGHLLAARAAEALGDTDAAIAALRTGLERVPPRAALPLRVRLADLLLRRGDVEGAERQLAGIQRETTAVLLLRGRIAAARGDAGRALALLRQAQARGAGPGALRAIVREAWRRGERDLALRSVRAWLERDEADRLARLLEAELLLAAGRTDEARGRYEAILRRWPDDPIALNNLASLLADEDLTRALELARRAAARAPRAAGVADTLGWLLHRADRDEEALAHLRRAVAARPKEPAYRYHLATVLARLGRTSEARAELEEALGLGEFGERAAAETLLAELRGEAARGP